MGKHEVTQRQWEAVMGTNPSHFKDADRPVEGVSWDDAQKFMGKLNGRKDGYRYRLPSEAEWEYAARAGSTGAYFLERTERTQIGWSEENSGGQSHPVGQKRANAWGFHDMQGNVVEWCSDWFDENYYASSPGIDPAGPASGDGRILRGGSWYYHGWNLRVSMRFGIPASFRDNFIGFRCVRER